MISLVLWAGFYSAVHAQDNLPIYTDNLVNGFQDWSWGTHNLANTSPVHSGSDSISANFVAWNGGLSFEHPDFDGTTYSNLTFWANGGAGGQILQVYVQYGTSQGPNYTLSALPANTWQQFVIPFSSLGAVGITNLNRFTLQLTSNGTTNAFYVDDIQLGAAPAPSLVHLSADAGHTVRTVDGRWFGLNTAVWDSYFDTPATSNSLKELGTFLLRFPGGSLSDQYNWAADTTLTNTWQWGTSFTNFMHIATNVGAQAIITVNYGTGTSNEAAAWVRFANITNHCGFKYWEVGNECYGSWETDSNTYPHDPYTYAVRAAGYIQLMRAADPTIHIGVVGLVGEDNGVNNYTNHPATNAITGQVHYGWTPVLLSTLKKLGVTPDFLIDHRYPEYTSAGSVNSADSDPLVLQTATTSWAGDASDLRGQINGYFGGAGTNIELCVTENNADAGAEGRQSTSIVNALFLADTVSQLMLTEFNSYIWWDLRNGADYSGDFDPTLYGWRTNGDEGILLNSNTRYPTFYADKLLQYFAQPGDTVLNATSDYPLLSAYATRKADGALAMLVINKSVSSSFTAQIQLDNFSPAPAALVRAYGIAQDQATRTNSTVPGAQDISTNSFEVPGTSFSNVFPPYSLTLLTIAPAAPELLALPPTNSQFNLQIQGQTNARYILQGRTDLVLGGWVDVATNTLTNGTWNFGSSITSPATFWRTIWTP